MRLLAATKIDEFIREYPTARPGLNRWRGLILGGEYRNYMDLKNVFGPSVDWREPHVIFDIGGNKFRLMAVVKYMPSGIVQIVEILTHDEYLRKYGG